MKTGTQGTSSDLYSQRLPYLRERNNVGAISERQVGMLVRILSVLNSEEDPERELDSLLIAIAEEFGAHSAALWIHDSNTGAIAFYETPNHSRSGEARRDASPTPEAGISWFNREALEQMLANGPMVIRDVPRSSLVESKARKWMAASGIRSLFCIPLRVSEGVTGILTIRATLPGAFAAGEEILGHFLGLHVSLAVHSMRQSELAEETAVLKERRRMAEEIHDGLTQNLAAIVTRLELALDVFPESPDEARAFVRQAQELAREGVTEARSSVWALAPPALSEHNLPGALKNLSSRFGDGSKTNLSFSLQGTPHRLSQQTETNLLRVAQEAISNAVRHGHASRVQVGLVYADGKVKLTVQDNGRGFDAEQAKRRGFGLFSLRDRTRKSGGNLTISSSEGGGTQILVEVPSELKNPEGRLA